METELQNNLISLAREYGAALNLRESTIGRLSAKDGGFFSRLRKGSSFTARKYDEVILWFSEHWPDGVDWPADIPRPARKGGESEAA